MGEPPLEIVAYSSGPFFPFRLKQNKLTGYRRWKFSATLRIG
jgi:hypothetical protein